MENRRSNFRKFPIFSGAGACWRVSYKTKCRPPPAQKIVYFKASYRFKSTAAEAIVEHGSNANIHPEVITRGTPRVPVLSSLPDFAEAFKLRPGLISRHCLAYGNADPAITGRLRAGAPANVGAGRGPTDVVKRVRGGP
jgi:hypothetical protein